MNTNTNYQEESLDENFSTIMLIDIILIKTTQKIFESLNYGTANSKAQQLTEILFILKPFFYNNLKFSD